MTRSRTQGVVLVGAGPGGLAPLFAAACSGELQALLDRGVTILERGFEVGAGALGRYAITSDSAADAILSIVTDSRESSIAALRFHPAAEALAAYGKGAAPLALAGAFLQVAGEAMCKLVAASALGKVHLGAQAQSVRQSANDLWNTHFLDAAGRAHTILSSSVVLATGASQPHERLHQELVAGAPLLPTLKAKLVQSGDVLTPEGLADVGRRLRGLSSPRVAIVGGSTSAAAIALALLTRVPGVSFGPKAVTILHRRPMRIFYESAADARQDGYTEFTDADLCAITGRVYRLAGLRLDSREFMMRVRGIAGRSLEPRVCLFDLRAEPVEAARRCLDEADLIIAALGYRPRRLPVFDARQQPVPLWTPTSKHWAVVDQGCRLLTAEDRPLPGLFALGLGIGPAASRELGGERDFHGQVNSLWLWQHTLGQRVARQAIERADVAHVSLTDEPRPSGFAHLQRSSIRGRGALESIPQMAGIA